MGNRILVIEDEEEIRTNLKYLLEMEEFEVYDASSGVRGVEMARKYLPDLIISDIMMPGLNGYRVLEQLRQDPSTVHIPVIFLTAKNSREDLRQGMQLGADDYISKPFTQLELLEAVKTRLQRQVTLKTSILQPITSNLRTASSTLKSMLASLENGSPAEVESQTAGSVPTGTPGIFTANGLSIDYELRVIVVEGQEVKLSPRQYKLLVFLAENVGKIVAHKNILYHVWGPEYEEETQYLHVFVNQLRQKIEPDPHNPRYILTERGFGYRLNVPKAKASK